MYLVTDRTEGGRRVRRFATLAEAMAVTEDLAAVSREQPCPICGSLEICDPCFDAADPAA